MYGVELTTEERIAEALEAIAKQQDIMTTVLSNMNTRDRMMLAAVERIAAVLEAQQQPVAEPMPIAAELAWFHPNDLIEAEQAGWKKTGRREEDGMGYFWYHMRRPRQQPAPDASDAGDGDAGRDWEAKFDGLRIAVAGVLDDLDPYGGGIGDYQAAVEDAVGTLRAALKKQTAPF